MCLPCTHHELTTYYSPSQEDMAKLFGLFSKIRDKRVENPLGVGLGLAICKQLVELMRGQIHVTSVYGRGTKFFFTAIHGRSTEEETAAAVKVSQ